MSYRSNTLHEPRERSAQVWGLGTVRTCDCGHRREPQHFQIVDSSTIRAVCPRCHVVTLQIELE